QRRVTGVYTLRQPAGLNLPGETKTIRRSNVLEDSVFESRGEEGTRKAVTAAVSVMAHVVTLVLLALIPLIEMQAITIPPPDISLRIPKSDDPKRVEVFVSRPRVQKYSQSEPNVVTAPQSIPSQIKYVEEPPRPPEGMSSIGTDTAGSLLRDLLTRRSDAELPSSLP